MEVIHCGSRVSEEVQFCFRLIDMTDRCELISTGMSVGILRESNSQTHYSETMAAFHRLTTEVVVVFACT